jgi:hypothetical protein
MNRKQEQAELMFKLGMLLGPLKEVAENPQATFDQLRQARAKYANDKNEFTSSVGSFSKSESGHYYEAEFGHIQQKVAQFHSMLSNLESVAPLAEQLKAFADVIRDELLSIPTPLDDAILPTRTPFSCYCLINDLCRTVNKRFVLVDGYFGDGFGVFYRYVRNVPQNVDITLVTWPENKYRQPTDWKALMDVSRLFAAERGLSNYRLVTSPTIHDRWLWCDEQVYILGGSLKDAGLKAKFSITKMESTSANTQSIEELINTGTELFGPAKPNHP